MVCVTPLANLIDCSLRRLKKKLTKKVANANNLSDFTSIFAKAFKGVLIDRMERNEEV